MGNKILMNKKVINNIGNIQTFDVHLVCGEYTVYNIYDEDLKSFDINIKQDSNTYLVINLAGYIKDKCTININSLLLGDNSKCIIKARFIAKENEGIINATVKVPEKSKDNFIVEDLKGYLEKGSLVLMPILEIDTSEVEANHNASVGTIPIDELFYLQSKGIDEDKALELLKLGFILSPFDKEFIKLIRKVDYE